jgi:hypothetical protein
MHSNNEIRVSKRAKLGLAITDVTDMNLYDFVKSLGDISQREKRAVEAYRKFIDFKNDKLLCEDKDGTNEFPISGPILRELIEFWTQYYACNTIRFMITLVHQHQIKIGYPKFKRQERWIIVDEALNIAKQKGILCAEKMENLEKEQFNLVTLHILNLVPETHTRHKFYVLLFLFMFNTGQRFISMSNIMITDIKNDIFFENIRIIVNIVCRITKANQDWNQYFNIEGDLTEKSIMNFVYWLNEFLKEEHELDIMNLKIRDKNMV